jgi:predicted TIM-barrel fold metal-dependent hydrolase
MRTTRASRNRLALVIWRNLGDYLVGAFGLHRVMIGSDWPVCTLSGGYEATMGIVIDYLRQFTTEERDGVLGGNCARIYKIDSRLTAADRAGAV